jgi:hypothetical protein
LDLIDPNKIRAMFKECQRLRVGGYREAQTIDPLIFGIIKIQNLIKTYSSWLKEVLAQAACSLAICFPHRIAIEGAVYSLLSPENLGGI